MVHTQPDGPDMILALFRPCQRFPHQPAHPLPEGGVEPFNGGCAARFLAAWSVARARQDGGIRTAIFNGVGAGTCGALPG